MALDSAANFAYTTVATAPSPPTSGTTLGVTAGTAYLFATPPFNAVVTPASTTPTLAVSGILRVTTIPTTTIAVASNTAVLPQATINVASTTGHPTSGTFGIVTSLGVQAITYTGVTGTTFTGCTGGTGTLSTGGLITNDLLTIIRAQESTIAKPIAIGWVIDAGPTAKLITDINAAIPNKSFDAIVAPTGGDYTTIVAALAAGKVNIGVRGSITETLQINPTVAVSITGIGGRERAIINLPNDATKTALFNQDNTIVDGVTFVGGSVNLSDNITGWVNFIGNNLVVENCGFQEQGSATTTTGNSVNLGKLGTGNFAHSKFRNNYFSNNNAGYALIKFTANNVAASEITDNQVYGSQLKRFFYADITTNVNVHSLILANNYGYAVSGHASGNFIDINLSAGSGQLLECSFTNNQFRLGANFTNPTFFIYIQTGGSGLSPSVIVDGNSCENGAGNSWGDIFVVGLPGCRISSNQAGTLTVYTCPGGAITGNTPYQLLNNGNNSQHSSWTGNAVGGGGMDLQNLSKASIVGNTSNGYMAFNGSSDCVITGNIEYATTISATSMTGGVIANNIATGNFTVSGSTTSMSGNRSTGGTVTNSGATFGSHDVHSKLRVLATMFSATITDTSTTTTVVDLQKGNVHYISLTANITTLTLNNPQDGAVYDFHLVQDATGGRTVAFPAAVLWSSGTAPTLSAATKADIITLKYNATTAKYYGSFLTNF